MKFLADGMLGKVTRWLRMIGCDVKYFNDLDDEKLISISIEEDRILLTRDIELFRRAVSKGAVAFFVEGRDEVEKLAEIGEHFNLNLEINVEDSRCPKCNARIRPVSKDEVEKRIPPATFRFYNEFWECPNCGQIYWQGSHWKRISRTLLEARKKMKALRKDEAK
ncbi:TPA: hypothetical protein EYP75_04765 [Candidatus Bathyarchaeota archaeon]|nr:hypothetical protein [Candidatus Bathyarchaeota archaeon]